MKLRPVVQQPMMAKRTLKEVVLTDSTITERPFCCSVMLYVSSGLSLPTPLVEAAYTSDAHE